MPAQASVAFRIADPRITEASGIAVGVRSPGVVYVQNDSGDSARFFALDARTGATAATVTVAGAEAVDWEDIAAAPDAAGTPSVWLADIGDNDGTRTEVDVYRVDEPAVASNDRGRSVITARADVWRLRYPSGPTDAESLAVTPAGVGYVVTKSVLGGSVVYRLPADPDARRVQDLVEVGSVPLAPTGTANPFGLPGELAATGAAFSADGSRFALRTYSDVRVWTVRGGDLAAALRGAPAVAALPAQPQGEGVAFDGDRLLVDSEGARTPVWSVPVPVRSPAPGRTSSATSAGPTASTAPSSGVATPGTTTTGGSAGGAPGKRSDGGRVTAAVIFGVALTLIGGACLANRRWFRGRFSRHAR